MLEDDLVDTCKPGGRISVVGVYKAISPRATGVLSGVFKAVVVGNSVRQLSRESDRDLTADDIRCASPAEAPVLAHGQQAKSDNKVAACYILCPRHAFLTEVGEQSKSSYTCGSHESLYFSYIFVMQAS